jgi:lysophospholipase L1-like esterase
VADSAPAAIRTYVAIGDSFTEGLSDTRPDGTYRGWADLLAGHLARHLSGHPAIRPATPANAPPGGATGALQYANLAIRGKLLGQVAGEQVEPAVALRPDLVSIAAGGNDLIRPGGVDADALADVFEDAVGRLQDAGVRVLLVTGFPPPFPLLRRVRGRVALYNLHLRAIADRQGCLVVDPWAMPPLRDPRAWSIDRLHLAADGHRRIALRAAEVLGIPVGEDWREPLPVVAPVDRASQLRADLRWTREHLLPWVGRRISGRSSGDGITAKRPDLAPLD